MPLTNTATTYGSIAKTLHWLTAGGVIFLLGLGVYMRRLPRDSAEDIATVVQFYSLHKTLGMAVLGVALLRVIWRLVGPRPQPLAAHSLPEHFAAHLVHWLLYIGILAMPLSGWLRHAATTGFAPIHWPFGQDLPFIPKSEALASLFSTLHWLLALLVGLSVLAHVGGAVKHIVIDRDRTLQRMLPFTRAEPLETVAHRSAFPAFLAIAAFGMAGLAAVIWPRNAPPATAQTLVAPASQWTVEDGSTLSISIQQFGATVTGQFDNWVADIRFDPENPAEAQINVTIAMDSLTLGSVSDTARGPDYLDVTGFASASWVANGVQALGDGHYRADGTLTLRGMAAPVPLEFDLEIEADHATMQGSTVVNRLDFGVGAVPMPDDSSLGFEVRIDVSLGAQR